ncbi:MAG: response regulator [Solirubrobacterales bacterium]
MANGTPSLVLIDDHSALRDGLGVLLERRGFRVLATADTARAGEAAIGEHNPAIAVVALALPDESGAALIRRLAARGGELKLLVYTGVSDSAILSEALDCGADGFVAKASDLAVLIEGLREVARGNRYRDPVLIALSRAGSEQPRVLSRREAEILELLTTGLTGEQVAERLVLSPETIRTHVRNAMGKLDARTRTEAVVKALDRQEIRKA